MRFGCFFFFLPFFFQAEDGIRDLVRSRGLGDVYKRQGVLGEAEQDLGSLRCGEIETQVAFSDVLLDEIAPVSYTHLTLPTSDLV